MSRKDLSMTNYEGIIRTVIHARGSVGGQDLVLAVMADTNVSKFDNEIYVTSLENMSQKKEIVHIMYTPPNGYSGVLYFPGGTKFEF